MGKTRVAVKLKEAVGGKSLNKSADLEAHRQAFNTFSKKLKALIGALKNHYGSMMSIAKTRLEVRGKSNDDVASDLNSGVCSLYYQTGMYRWL
jgi:translation initiation factor 1 (eIF-1/SUI1)